MTPSTLSHAPGAAPGRPVWHRAVLTAAALGLAWNLFGVMQFVRSLSATPESLMHGGLGAAQAAVYLALPGWMDIAFGAGVFGGLAGCVALALRRRVALPLLGASMASYIALYLGDLRHGLFDAVPAQHGVLIVVLAVAAVLLAGALVARRAGGLR